MDPNKLEKIRARLAEMEERKEPPRGPQWALPVIVLIGCAIGFAILWKAFAYGWSL